MQKMQKMQQVLRHTTEFQAPRVHFYDYAPAGRCSVSCYCVI